MCLMLHGHQIDTSCYSLVILTAFFFNYSFIEGVGVVLCGCCWFFPVHVHTNMHRLTFSGYVAFAVAKEMVLKPKFIYVTSLCERRVHMRRSLHHAASHLDCLPHPKAAGQSFQNISASVSAHLLLCTCPWQKRDVSRASRRLFRLFFW